MARVVEQRDLRLADGRTLRAYDVGGEPTAALVWHHGSPQSGAPLPPLLQAAAERGIRLVSYARPSYGGSTPQPGRDVASAAGDVAQLADAFGLERFAGHGRVRWRAACACVCRTPTRPDHRGGLRRRPRAPTPVRPSG